LDERTDRGREEFLQDMGLSTVQLGVVIFQFSRTDPHTRMVSIDFEQSQRLLAIAIHEDAIQCCSHAGQVYGQSRRRRLFGRWGLLAALGFRRRALGLGLAV
jgi:hypothetical protein